MSFHFLSLKNTKFLKEFLVQTFWLSLGSCINAFAIKALLMPQDLLSLGLTGYALLIFYKWNALPLGVIFFIINIPIFVLGWKFSGKRFFAYSIWGFLIYSVVLSLIQFEIQMDDTLLITLISAALIGTGTAMILRSYGSCGGSDILCVILHKFFGLSLGQGALFLNGALLMISFFIFPLERVLYTLVFMYVSSLVTDKVFHSMAKRRTVLILSDKWIEISEEMKKKGIRVTVLEGKGGYLGGKQTMLYSVLPARSVPVLKNLTKKLDKSAFITIMNADDVTGVEVGNQPHW